MTDGLFQLLIALSGLAATAMLTLAGLRGWRGWLDLKRQELMIGRPPIESGGVGSRIELADLKERVRKLEAIAAGVDL